MALLTPWGEEAKQVPPQLWGEGLWWAEGNGAFAVCEQGGGGAEEAEQVPPQLWGESLWLAQGNGTRVCVFGCVGVWGGRGR